MTNKTKNHVDTKTMAGFIGISVGRLCQLNREKKVPRERDGLWDPAKVFAALKKNLDARQSSKALGRIGTPAAPPGGSFHDAQRRHELARAEKAELDLRIRKGEIVEVADLNESLGACVIAMRDRAEVMPGNLSQRLAIVSDPIEIEMILRSELDAMLRDFADWEPPTNASAGIS